MKRILSAFLSSIMIFSCTSVYGTGNISIIETISTQSKLTEQSTANPMVTIKPTEQATEEPTATTTPTEQPTVTDAPLLAFPGAEGGGKYTKGARAALDNNEEIEVYHVTNLKDSGDGSFRDAVSKNNRIIVFDIGGTISLNSPISIKGNNLTILGQTAPGDGITIKNWGITFFNSGNSMIMRYLKIRPGDTIVDYYTAMIGQHARDVIIDHISASWANDELISIYAGTSERPQYPLGNNLTIQNCLISEPLNLSHHYKGEHGYGSIFGAYNSTLYHSVYAHSKSRNPMLDREVQKVNITNNIMYNHGGEAYGAYPHSYNGVNISTSSVNFVENYFKNGPNSLDNTRDKFYNVTNKYPEKSKASFYFSGNVLEGVPEVTQNNILGVKNTDKAILLDKPLDLGEYEVPEETAYETYNTILATVGACIPKRDSIDARVIDDIKNGTGRIINSQKEVGGHIKTEVTYREFIISDEWKTANNMGNAIDTDIVPSGEYKGYTWIEAYIFDYERSFNKPTNPHITVESPTVSTTYNTSKVWEVIDESELLTYSALITPEGGTDITKAELICNTEVIRSYTVEELTRLENGAYKLSIGDIDLDVGTNYITLRAYNDKGESTDSLTSIVYVIKKNNTEKYKHIQIGNTPYNKKGSSFVDAKGILTVSGSGKLTNSNKDNCDFVYREVSGDFEYTAKIESIPKDIQEVISGMMLRESLDPSSRMVLLGDEYLKFGENIRTLTRTVTGGYAQFGFLKNINGIDVSADSLSDYESETPNYPMPKYMKIKREDNNITLSVSNNGTDFTDNSRQPYTVTIPNLAETVYIGFAVESGSRDTKPYYNISKFRDITLNDEPEFEITEIEPVPDNEIIVYTLNNAYTDGFDYSSLSGGEDGVKYIESINGLSGYGGWEVWDRTCNYTYIDKDGFSYDYTFKKCWTAGQGNQTKRCLYFTPKSECKITAIFSGNAGRDLYIEQGGKMLTGVATGDVVEVSLETTDTTNPVYIFGAPSNKNIYAIIVEYYKDEQQAPATLHYKTEPTLSENTVSYSVANNSDKVGIFAVAVYDNSSNTLKDIKLIKIKPNETTNTPLIINAHKNDMIKAFLWDINLSPVANSLILQEPKTKSLNR